MTSLAVVPATTRRRDDSVLRIVVELAADLTDARTASERAQRLVDAIPLLIPCDSAVLLRLEIRDGKETLVPIASHGVVEELKSQRFEVAAHPRFAQIVRRRTLIHFRDASLPDPFDGLLISGQPLSRVHACMSAPLIVGGELLGVLAIDALDPRAFDRVDALVVTAFATLGAVGMRTAGLISALSQQASAAEQIVRQLARDDDRSGHVLCASAAMRAVVREAEIAARSDLAVLITGETGTGKEVVARSIHVASGRSERPLIYINCAALPESIAESELFGHVRGAFTGALDHRAGKFEIANHGTLFLDEIGELPLSIQPKLLRALQTGEIQRVGADQVERVDVRIIAATNRDLEKEVAAGRFRADLFHRLSVYPIELPPLRKRREDILLLAGFFLDDARIRLGLGAVRLTPDARTALLAHDWPGNVRELEHAILRAALRAARGRRRETVVIDAASLDLPAMSSAPSLVALPAPASTAAHATLEDAVDDFKRRRIAETVERCGGNWAEAARQLGVDRGNLHRTAKRLGIHG
ncbi:MAG TPA: nitric oxide reductase transcriptional regulator NorR [Kofleriaceae bacterium]|nr:nitric oxide reductase transcriptional regulator NorR [Kofleriaceae bacterium]